MQEVGLQSKESSFEIAKASSSKKNLFLNDLANRISRNEEEIIKVNHLDLDEAKRNNFDEAFVDRLTLNKQYFSY